MAKNPEPKYAPGDWVDYHSVIGGPPTELCLQVRHRQLGMYRWVYWLTGKAGCVAEEALSPVRFGRMSPQLERALEPVIEAMRSWLDDLPSWMRAKDEAEIFFYKKHSTIGPEPGVSLADVKALLAAWEDR